ncbi:MAG TPA: DUF1800 domain-containing protein, partial [Gemmataceae bacterium]|nr:DUF1800 domain-containing protein [Gemmataceae bacterium]
MTDASANTIDPRWAWQPYRPSSQAPWNLQRVGHLYRRAAFGATYTELEAGVKAGPEALIALLLKGGTGLAEFDASMEPLAQNIARYNDGGHLSAWWLTRMLHSPHPLQEKITLFWHNHFATSYAKVRSARFMLGQYELMRRHALGHFSELLREMSSDPAMLIWLDGRDSKKGNPNENYGRELMELFSLGIGHYTEKDIREAARAFTGWGIQETKAVFNPNQHDEGKKTVLGQTGNWSADDIVRICLEQESAAPFIVGKLYRFLISESIEPTPELLAPLARQFRKSGYDFGLLVKTILSSNLFFSSQVYRTRIKSPVDFLLNIVRGLEGKIGTTALAQSLEQLGQNLFSPPSVKGWDGGRSWLNGQTLLFRQNLALALTSTEDARFGRRCDPGALARKYDKKTDTELVDFFLRVFLQGDVSAEERARLLDYQQHAHKLPAPVFWTEQEVADHRVRSLCHLVLTLP